jgi:hypothetical protein
MRDFVTCYLSYEEILDVKLALEYAVHEFEVQCERDKFMGEDCKLNKDILRRCKVAKRIVKAK